VRNHGTVPEVRLATLVKTDLGKWKAIIRKTGWPTTSKTFRAKRDAEDWARRMEDDMVRGAYIQRASASPSRRRLDFEDRRGDATTFTRLGSPL